MENIIVKDNELVIKNVFPENEDKNSWDNFKRELYITYLKIINGNSDY